MPATDEGVRSKAVRRVEMGAERRREVDEIESRAFAKSARLKILGVVA